MGSQELARRRYRQHCGLAHALDLVGERWTLLVVRELLLGPLRYSDLLADLPGIGTNLLARRLNGLMRAGIVERRVLPPPAGSTAYALTRRGRQLEPALVELARFGGRFLPDPPDTDTVHARWTVVGLKHTFRAAAADTVHTTYQLNLDEEPYRLRVDHGMLHAYQGEAEQADLTIQTTTPRLLDLLGAHLTPDDGVADRSIQIEGSIEDLRQFVRLFGWGSH